MELKVLDLSGTQVTDISGLSSCPKLNRLHLWSTEVTDISCLSSLKCQAIWGVEDWESPEFELESL